MKKQNEKKEHESQLSMIWRRFYRNKSAMLGLGLLAFLIIATLLGFFIVDYNTDVVGMDMAQRLQAPGGGHLFGTDQYGRDIFARILYGARISLTMGVVIIVISFTIGGIIGSVSGYYGGFVDNILM